MMDRDKNRWSLSHKFPACFDFWTASSLITASPVPSIRKWQASVHCFIFPYDFVIIGDLIRPSRFRLTEDSQSLSKEEMMSVAHSYARKTQYITHKASVINPALVAAISDSRRKRQTRAP